jgi:hypothetical protein
MRVSPKVFIVGVVISDLNWYTVFVGRSMQALAVRRWGVASLLASINALIIDVHFVGIIQTPQLPVMAQFDGFLNATCMMQAEKCFFSQR